MQSIQFKDSTEPPITLDEGMEKECWFTSGSQEEGQKVTAEYIAHTRRFHTLKSQMKELPDGPEKDQLKKQHSEIVKKVRSLQRNKYVVEFSGAVRESQDLEMLKKAAKTIEELRTSDVVLPVLEGLHPSLPPLKKRPPPDPYQPGSSRLLKTPPKQPPDRQGIETARKSLLNKDKEDRGGNNDSNIFSTITGNKGETVTPATPSGSQDTTPLCDVS